MPPGPNDVTIGVLSRLTRALDRAARAGAVARTLPIYLTEFGIQSQARPARGVSCQQQAEYRAISERIAYDNPRVRVLLAVPAARRRPAQGQARLQRYRGFESGPAHRGRQGEAGARRLPAAARRPGRAASRASLWGLVRPATGATTATIQYRNGAKGSFRDLAKVTTNALGVFKATVGYRRARQYRLEWTAPDATALDGGPIRAYR